MSLTKPIPSNMTSSIGCLGCRKSCMFAGVSRVKDGREITGRYGCNDTGPKLWQRLYGKFLIQKAGGLR